MRVAIGAIKGKKGAALPFEFEERSGDWGLPGESAPYPVRVRGTVLNTGATFYVDAVAEAELGLHCDRCLGPVRSAVRAEVKQAFLPAQRPRPVDPDGDAAPDDELLPVADDAVDLWPAVRSAILLAMPMKVLCRPDCGGLCPLCGQERSAGPCGCAPPADPRLLPLNRLVENVEN